ncbi:site-2 protease family protein [Actinotalea sp. M2MS4P-6]|uniref:M50 family metallopeptidase n=1 Tax=Actinotalea sp. M2MS4P-6 TaxID=2983762 RepID=UPI0021E36EA0|nr:site-2 protease family protein [Actinotalea sp. M2MS4P-6]MCV2396109.1 site-2 protease family protein [Actinotalea sp. M2MS4P-6]
MFLIGLLVLVVGLLASIALHEVGHMVPAKRFGVRVSQYMVGFGPTLWSRQRGETEYGFKAIPLGGYVRLVGMYPPAEALDRPPRPGRFAELIDAARQASAEEIRPGEDHRAFYRLSAPKKAVVMLGGPFMNLVIAGVLLAVVLVGIGVPGSATTTVAVVGQCVTTDFAAECTAGDTPTPAAAAGLQPGDTILSYGGREVTSWSDVQAAIKEVPGEDIPVVVERDGQQITLSVSPVTTQRPVYGADGQVETDADGNPVLAPTRYVGFSPTAAIERQPVSSVLPALGSAVWQTMGIVVALPVQMVDVVKAAAGLEQRDSSSVLGVVGVARVAGEIGAVPDVDLGQRIAAWLALLASLNVALFVFNLIPLVPLDGGHVAGAVWEGARRTRARLRGLPRPAPSDVARMVPLAYGVFAVLAVLGLVLVVADLAAPVTI